MEYRVLFGINEKSIQFQGKEGIVSPIDILFNGRIIRNDTTAKLKNNNNDVFTYIHSTNIIFVPDTK
jgi:hypothetical protein